jgi:hypothetical protein
MSDLVFIQNIQQEIVNFYLKSKDFNGISYSSIEDKFGKDSASAVLELARKKIIDIYFDDENPYIMRLPLDYDKTLKEFENKIKSGEKNKKVSNYGNNLTLIINSWGCCLYPSEALIKENIGSHHLDHPYSRELALKRYHFSYKFFDRSFLIEIYQDPRYEINMEDFQGSLYFTGENDTNKFWIEHFYFGLNEKNKELHQRPVAIMLSDLHNLSSKEQHRFKYYELENQDDYTIHPVSEKMIIGLIPSYTTIFKALITEIQNLNKIFIKKYGLKIFKEDYSDRNNLKTKSFYRDYDYLNIPTKKAYNNFVHTLFKVIIDNLNKDLLEKIALENNINLKTENEEKKGTLTLLVDYLKLFNTDLPQKFKNTDLPQKFKKFVKDKIKPNRSQNAHDFIEDEYNEKYLEEQICVMEILYSQIRGMREIFVKVNDFKNEIREINKNEILLI